MTYISAVSIQKQKEKKKKKIASSSQILIKDRSYFAREYVMCSMQFKLDFNKLKILETIKGSFVRIVN